jgi:hypothetical protein
MRSWVSVPARFFASMVTGADLIGISRAGDRRGAVAVVGEGESGGEASLRDGQRGGGVAGAVNRVRAVRQLVRRIVPSWIIPPTATV